MTFTLPGRRGTSGRHPAPRGTTPGPRKSAPAPRIPVGLALAPPSGSTPETAAPRVHLSATGKLGAALLLLVGLLVQRTLLPLLPWGPADLVTVLVACLGILAGPAAGCLGGFGVGFAADVLSDHALGRLAAVLCVVGYACGLLAGIGERRFRYAWLAIAVACAVTPLLFAVTGAFVGDTRAAGSLLLTRCIAGLCYGIVLAPLAYPLTRRLLAPRTRRRRGRVLDLT